jgi:hypothetical protein
MPKDLARLGSRMFALMKLVLHVLYVASCLSILCRRLKEKIAANMPNLKCCTITAHNPDNDHCAISFYLLTCN